MLDLTEENLRIIKKILHTYVPGARVWAFGSRVNGKARRFSDLDIAVINKTPIADKAFMELKEAFSESDLPFKVDVINWQAITEDFRDIIRHQYIVIQ